MRKSLKTFVNLTEINACFDAYKDYSASGMPAFIDISQFWYTPG